jgi:hypothetical protein
VNLQFCALFYLNLSFYCVFALSVCEFYLVKALLPLFLRFFISDGLPNDSPDDSNRIREVDELVPLAIKIGDGVSYVRAALAKLSGEKTEYGLVLYAGLLSCLFVLTYRLNFLMVSAVLVNAGLLLPAFLLHPEVVKVQGVIFRKKEEKTE